MRTRRFSEILDTITTTLRFITTFLFVAVAVVCFIGMNQMVEQSGSLMENMPDGSGVADGYIVLGKVFGGVLTGTAGIFAGVIMMIAAALAVVGIIFCLVYFFQRRSYAKTGEFRFLRRNLTVKCVVNALHALAFLWIMIEEEAYGAPFWCGAAFFVIMEVLLLSSRVARDEFGVRE